MKNDEKVQCLVNGIITTGEINYNSNVIMIDKSMEKSFTNVSVFACKHIGEKLPEISLISNNCFNEKK